MVKLSKPISRIKAAYDAVVIGSGYGASIAAARLARAGQKVCLLERGREFEPKDMPADMPAAAKEFQVTMRGKHTGNETGLYDMRVHDDINVFIGCGLGGTSLINANVALEPDLRVFEDPAWPGPIRQEAAGGRDNLLMRGFNLARRTLAARPYPGPNGKLSKLDAHRQSAEQDGAPFYRPPIAVNFEDGKNPFGMHQPACNDCGDCVSGCRFGSKNVLTMNYLPDAVNNGAEIFTETPVSHVQRQGDEWLVFFSPSSLGREAFDAPDMYVRAPIVILGAGTLGSTEILMRSREKGLAVSDQLGEKFTGNGDVLAFGYNNDVEINGVGAGDEDPAGLEPVGPCITGIIDRRNSEDVEDGMVIEEGSLPGALAPVLPAIFSTAARALGQDTDEGFLDRLSEEARILESRLRGARHGAMGNTQTYLVMAHDDAGGRMALEDNRIRVHWPDVQKQPVFREIEKQLVKATGALGGTYVKNPISAELLGENLITVHPLGGCSMGERAETGVVSHNGAVFNGSTGEDTHEGLYVVDGAIMPRSLGVNPLLTICALAERSMSILASDRGWQTDDSWGSEPAAGTVEAELGLQFTETMRGHISDAVAADYEMAAAQGKAADSPFEFTLTVMSDNLDRMLAGSEHMAPIVGTALAPALSDNPLMVVEGRFQLLVKDPDVIGARRMIYRMTLADRQGRRWYFDAFKFIRDDRGFDLWSDTTTLYVTIHDGADAQAPAAFKGMLNILPADFARQATTVRARNSRNMKESITAAARFGRFFAGSLGEVFGGVLAPDFRFNPDAPPRKRRPLRCGDPEEIPFRTEDGVDLLFKRYTGGDKGPVMLSHGLGVNGLIFAIDTIETNLVEYLAGHGYDVWNLEWRGSIDLPASEEKFTFDEVAQYDYPAAIARIRAVTGADKVDVVAHCAGATTFNMSLLRGLEHVRSAVFSQFVHHMVSPPLSKAKAALYVPEVMERLGVDRLDAYSDAHVNWLERLYDDALRFYPIEAEDWSNNPVSRRINFIYGQLWEQDQLNPATSDAMHELFGIANIRSLQHLAEMMRTGHLVAYDGTDSYMPHLDRMKLPVTVIHGAENNCFFPESTERSVQGLSAANGSAYYNRVVIPDYGHIDCIFGRNAAKDVYPHILAHLQQQS